MFMENSAKYGKWSIFFTRLHSVLCENSLVDTKEKSNAVSEAFDQSFLDKIKRIEYTHYHQHAKDDLRLPERDLILQSALSAVEYVLSYMRQALPWLSEELPICFAAWRAETQKSLEEHIDTITKLDAIDDSLRQDKETLVILKYGKNFVKEHPELVEGLILHDYDLTMQYFELFSNHNAVSKSEIICAEIQYRQAQKEKADKDIQNLLVQLTGYEHLSAIPDLKLVITSLGSSSVQSFNGTVDAYLFLVKSYMLTAQYSEACETLIQALRHLQRTQCFVQSLSQELTEEIFLLPLSCALLSQDTALSLRLLEQYGEALKFSSVPLHPHYSLLYNQQYSYVSKKFDQLPVLEIINTPIAKEKVIENVLDLIYLETLAIAYYQNREFKKSIDLFERVNVHLLWGSMSKLPQYLQAIRIFNYHKIGQAYLMQNQISRALSAYTQVIKELSRSNAPKVSESIPLAETFIYLLQLLHKVQPEFCKNLWGMTWHILMQNNKNPQNFISLCVGTETFDIFWKQFAQPEERSALDFEALIEYLSDIASIAEAFANDYFEQKNYRAAVEHYEMVENEWRHDSPNQPNHVILLTKIAYCYYYQRYIAAAFERLVKAIELQRTLFIKTELTVLDHSFAHTFQGIKDFIGPYEGFQKLHEQIDIIQLIIQQNTNTEASKEQHALINRFFKEWDDKWFDHIGYTLIEAESDSSDSSNFDNPRHMDPRVFAFTQNGYQNASQRLDNYGKFFQEISAKCQSEDPKESRGALNTLSEELLSQLEQLPPGFRKKMIQEPAFQRNLRVKRWIDAMQGVVFEENEEIQTTPEEKSFWNFIEITVKELNDSDINVQKRAIKKLSQELYAKRDALPPSTKQAILQDTEYKQLLETKLEYDAIFEKRSYLAKREENNDEARASLTVSSSP